MDDDRDISWLTQSDNVERSNFQISPSFIEEDNVVSLEENSNLYHLYDGVFAENISDDEAIDTL